MTPPNNAPAPEWPESKLAEIEEYCGQGAQKLDSWREPNLSEVEFYARARTDLPAVVKEVRRLRADKIKIHQNTLQYAKAIEDAGLLLKCGKTGYKILNEPGKAYELLLLRARDAEDELDRLRAELRLIAGGANDTGEDFAPCSEDAVMIAREALGTNAKEQK